MLGSFSVLKDPAPLARLEAVYVIVCSSMLIIANIRSHVKSYFKKSTNISDSCLRGLGSPQGTVEWAWDHSTMLATKMPQALFVYSLKALMSEQATSLYVQIRRFDGTGTACQGQGP